MDDNRTRQDKTRTAKVVVTTEALGKGGLDGNNFDRIQTCVPGLWVFIYILTTNFSRTCLETLQEMKCKTRANL